MNQKLPLTERIRIVGLNISVARASYDIWWIYRGAETRPGYIEAMDEFSEFFRFDQEAHFRAMIVGLHTIFDTTKNTISLKSIVSEALTGQDLVIMRSRLAQIDGHVRRIKVLRHKLFAHRDDGLSYDQVFRDAQLRPDDIKALLDESSEILNFVARKKDGREIFVNEIVSSHTEALLQRIKPS